MTEIRTKIAEDLKKEFTKGDEAVCIPAKEGEDYEESDMKKVCEKHYAD